MLVCTGQDGISLTESVHNAKYVIIRISSQISIESDSSFILYFTFCLFCLFPYSSLFLLLSGNSRLLVLLEVTGGFFRNQLTLNGKCLS
jgi:hypothetical protein